MSATTVWSAFPFLMGTLGQLCTGWFTDRFMRGKRTAYIIFCQVVGPPVVFIAIGATSTAATILGFAVAMFFTAGAVGQYWVLMMDLIPGKVLGAATGTMNGIGLIFAFFVPVLMGRVYDVTHSFYWGFGSIAIVTFIGAIIAIPLLFYEKRVHGGEVKMQTVGA